MDNIYLLKREIEEIIKKSPVPEDPIHSKNTLEWVLKLKVDADEALKISALGHDIERAIEKRKVNRKDYKTFDEFKNAHAINSAKILAEIMKKYKIDNSLTESVFHLVSCHETGGTGNADILKNADTISFFHVNLPFYYNRNGIEDTKRRCLWGYRKLPDNLKSIVANFNYKNKELNSLIKDCIVKAEV